LILAGALVVIAAVALWASVHAPASDRKLDKVPAMPR
jgi:hypothetical protein